MAIKLYIFVCVTLVSAAIQPGVVEAGGGSSSSKGDGAPWGSYFSRGFGGFYSPDDFAPDPLPVAKPHRHGRIHVLRENLDDGADDTQRTLNRGDLLQSHIPAIPDAQSRNIPIDSKQQQGWAQDTQHDWSQDTQQHEQHDTQHDFQQDTQLSQHDIFEEDVQQHDTEPQDFVTGYPPAKGHHTHVPFMPTQHTPYHTQPPFHTTEPVQQTTYQPEPPTTHHTEPPTQQTTYQPDLPLQQTTYQPDLPLQQTTLQPDLPLQHTTYEPEPVQQTTYESENIKGHTTHSPEVTTFPGTSEYETTTYLEPHGPSGEGTCHPNPAARGYPHGTKLLCTVELCDPKSSGSKTSQHSQATLVCRPYTGCDDTGYTTEKPEYTTKDRGYTTDHPEYTTESHFTTEQPGYTTERGHTTDHPVYTTETEQHTTTEHPVYTTSPPHTTYTTEHPDYPTTQKEITTEKPVYTTERPSPEPTLPPPTTPRVEESTPCMRWPGVKGGAGGCDKGVKGGVKGVKGGHRQPSWDSWSSSTSWDDWESRRQGLRKQQTFWHPPRAQERRRHEEMRRPVWNGAWPSSFSVQHDPSPAAYVYL